jgi:hypothetical protein
VEISENIFIYEVQLLWWLAIAIISSFYVPFLQNLAQKDPAFEE